MYAVVNPATGEKLEEYPEISDDELDAAIGRAWEARKALASLSAAERAERTKRLGELHLEQRETLAAIAVKEMGKPMEQALGEVDFCGDIYGYYAERAEDFLKDEPIELLAGEGTAVIRRSAMGPLLGIMPWNLTTTNGSCKYPACRIGARRAARPNWGMGETDCVFSFEKEETRNATC